MYLSVLEQLKGCPGDSVCKFRFRQVARGAPAPAPHQQVRHNALPPSEYELTLVRTTSGFGISLDASQGATVVTSCNYSVVQCVQSSNGFNHPSVGDRLVAINDEVVAHYPLNAVIGKLSTIPVNAPTKFRFGHATANVGAGRGARDGVIVSIPYQNLSNPMPVALSPHVSPACFAELQQAYSYCAQNSNGMLCCIEWLVCLFTGFFCIFFMHLCCLDLFIDSQYMKNTCDRLNITYYGGARVVYVNFNSRSIVFDTTAIPSAAPAQPTVVIVQQQPQYTQPVAYTTAYPTSQPVMQAQVVQANPVPMVNPMPTYNEPAPVNYELYIKKTHDGIGLSMGEDSFKHICVEHVYHNVLHVISRVPDHAQGPLSGDRLIAIGDQNLSGYSLSAVLDILRSIPPESVIKLVFSRETKA